VPAVADQIINRSFFVTKTLISRRRGYMGSPIPHAWLGIGREKSGPFRRWHSEMGAVRRAGVQPEKENDRHVFARF